MASRPQRFSATVRARGANFYVEVPAKVSAAFARHAERGHVRVHGTLEGAAIRGTLVPRNNGHWLFLHAGMRAAAGGVSAGDRVALELRATSWQQVPITNDVRAALSKAGALAAFEARSPTERHEMLRWVDVATSRDERARRLARTIEQLQGKTAAVKTGQAFRRERQLWECPKCGHAFVNTNQWHSCKRYTLDQTFAGSAPHVRELFERIKAMVESVGPARVQAYRDKVAFLVRVRFIGVTPRKSHLDLGFWLPRRIDSPRFRKVETLTPTDHLHVLRVTDPDQLDAEVLGWIRESHAVGRQEHLG